MFGARVEDGVVGERDDRRVVTKDGCWSCLWNMKFCHYAPEPQNVRGGGGKRAVFSFNGGFGNGGLFLDD